MNIRLVGTSKGTEPLLFITCNLTQLYAQQVHFCQLAVFALVSLWGHVRTEILYPTLFPLRIPHPNPIKTRNPAPAHNWNSPFPPLFSAQIPNIMAKKSQIPHPAKPTGDPPTKAEERSTIQFSFRTQDPNMFLRPNQSIRKRIHPALIINWIFAQISFDSLLAFQFLRNDGATQISQSSFCRQHFGSDHAHTRHNTICIKGTNTSLLRVDSSFSFMLYYPSDLKSLSPTKAVKILCYERSASVVASAIYFFDPIEDITDLDIYKPFLNCLLKTYLQNALARQNVQLKYERSPVHCYPYPLPNPPPPPLHHHHPPSRLTLSYVTVTCDMARCFSLCVLPQGTHTSGVSVCMFEI